MKATLRSFGAGSVVSYNVPEGGIRNGWKVHGKKFSFMNENHSFVIQPGEVCVILEDTSISLFYTDHTATYLLVRNEVIVYFENQSNEKIWTNDGR